MLWIHPDEENILVNLDKAVKVGVCAFKMICNNFYAYKEKCMRLLRRIAQLGKPVFLHSGILWDRCGSFPPISPLPTRSRLYLKRSMLPTDGSYMNGAVPVLDGGITVNGNVNKTPLA